MTLADRGKHFGQIDALRSFAVLMVVLTHWLPNTKLGEFESGIYGVDMFFTISGFLITYLFFIDKERHSDGKGAVLGNFYMRRVLRIFPIYYLLLFVFILLNKTLHVWIWNEGNGIYYLTYASNILFFLKGDQSTELQHTWSLCVEEQFYIFWPLCLLFLSQRQTLYFLIAVFVTGIVSNFLWMGIKIRLFPIGNFHTLGIGALLAYLVLYHKQDDFYRTTLKKYCLPAFFASFALLCIFLFYHFSTTLMIPFLLSLSSGLILFIAYNGETTLLNPVLNSKQLQYLGKLSYGIYLYHKPIPSFLKIIFLKLHVALPAPPIYFLLCVAVIIPIVITSYYLIEKPILKLKTKFI